MAATALYTRDELEMFISDPRIPTDRQVLYGLEGLAGLRHGEAAGLRWKHYDETAPVLGKLIIATSYNKGRTKTWRTRYVPVHPTLAAMLAEWKQSGWPEMMGRAPKPDDLIVPMPAPTNRGGRRVEKGRMRSPHNSRDRLEKDLVVLGFRHRRGHDLRRTMISLARTDGARKDILELCTHNPGKGGSTIDLYTTFPWEALCAEVAKLRVQRPVKGEGAPVAQNASAEAKPPEAEGLDSALATSLATSDRNPESFPVLPECPRRDSKTWTGSNLNPRRRTPFAVFPCGFGHFQSSGQLPGVPLRTHQAAEFLETVWRRDAVAKRAAPKRL